MEVEHVKAHRTKKEKKDMSHFEKFVTEGNEKADELAKAGAILDERFMAEARAETMQQEREEVYAAFAVCSQLFHCLMEEWKDCEEPKPKLKEKWIFARMGNHAKRVNVCCALWMMRAVFSRSDLGPRRLSVRSMSVSSLL